MLDGEQIRTLCPGWPGSASVPVQQPPKEAGTADMAGPEGHQKKSSKDT